MSRRLLIVDDDPSVREALRAVLEGAGYKTVTAADGREGVEQLTGQSFDLLLLDLDLPEISGWDILDMVMARCPVLPVIVLTGFFNQCVPGALLGADFVLEKPPDVTQLLGMVTGLLSEPAVERLRRRSRDPGLASSSLPVNPNSRQLRW